MNVEGEVLREVFKKEIYDACSSAWVISFALLKSELEKARLTITFLKFFKTAEVVGLSLRSELEMLQLVDLFGSKYGSRFKKNIRSC